MGNPTVSNIAPATVTSSFGGIVALVNVLNLQRALSNRHPNREFINKLCLELGEEAGMDHSGPSLFPCLKNLPTAFFSPEVAASNLAEEVAKGRTMGPFRAPPYLRIS